MKIIRIYLLHFLDMLGFKSIARRGFARLAEADHNPYIVAAAATELMGSGQREKARKLLEDALDARPTLRCGRLLIHVYMKEKEFGKALEVTERLLEVEPDNPWLYLLKGDIQFFFLEDSETAFETFRQAFDVCRVSEWKFPIRVAYKRLCRFLNEYGHEDELLVYLRDFMELQPSNFHEAEFYLLGKGLNDRGEKDEAKAVFLKGIIANPRSDLLREAWEELKLGSNDELPPLSDRSRSVPSGVHFLPVPTRVLTEADDPVQVMKEYVPNPAADDIATISSCVVAIMEGRMLMEGVVNPGFWSRLLARFVDQTDKPFAGTVPMANPLSMQVLIEEIGTPRLIVAAIAGAVGKLLGKKGWFYVVAGDDSDQIDDVLGCLPPYDYYSIMGPKNSPRLARKMAQALGCEAAIVDACDIGAVRAVGYSKGVDAAWLERAMVSNPAGNQEQQTPIVVIQSKKIRMGESI